MKYLQCSAQMLDIYREKADSQADNQTHPCTVPTADVELRRNSEKDIRYPVQARLLLIWIIVLPLNLNEVHTTDLHKNLNQFSINTFNL